MKILNLMLLAFTLTTVALRLGADTNNAAAKAKEAANAKAVAESVGVLALTPTFKLESSNSTNDVVKFTDLGRDILVLTHDKKLIVCGKLLGRIDGTNFVSATANEPNFADGIRFGAIAAKRNPDLVDFRALFDIGRGLMNQEREAQQQQQSMLTK